VRRISFDITDNEERIVKTYLPILEKFKNVIPIGLLSIMEKIKEQLQ
jgi:hypothetical protein